MITWQSLQAALDQAIGVSPDQYYTVASQEGRTQYQSLLLDTNVVTELNNYYLRGLPNDLHAASRIRHFLYTHRIHGQLITGFALHERAWDSRERRINLSRHRALARSIDALWLVMDNHLPELLLGAIPQYVDRRPQKEIDPEDEPLDFSASYSARFLLPRYLVLRRAWELAADPARSSQERLHAFFDWVDNEVGYTSIYEMLTGQLLLAGRGHFASYARALLKYSPALSPSESARRIRGLVFDYFLLSLVDEASAGDSAFPIPAPSALLTIDKRLLGLRAICQPQVPVPALTRAAVAPEALFRPELVEAIRDRMRSSNSATTAWLQSDRGSPEQYLQMLLRRHKELVASDPYCPV